MKKKCGQEKFFRSFTKNWCTAIRLARNEAEEEAKEEGKEDGEKIVASFQGEQYIYDLAQNPLMLSAICLVNYFQGGELPEDRVLLYELCVEGLLHHWDQRRGIHSEFSLEEKLRVCREVAIAMQEENRAETNLQKVQEIFVKILNDDEVRGKKLLEQIRHRAGLLVERRPGIFAFVHLAFQEYLAAKSVYEGNHRGVEIDSLLEHYRDPRWKEVLPLYCGLAPAKFAKQALHSLIEQEEITERELWDLEGEGNQQRLAHFLAKAYLASGKEVQQDQELQEQILSKIAIAPFDNRGSDFIFPKLEKKVSKKQLVLIANQFLGEHSRELLYSEAHRWLLENKKCLNREML